MTQPNPNPPLNDSAREWGKDVNRAIAELQSGQDTNSGNLDTVMYTAEVAIDVANATQENIEQVIIPSIEAPLAVPAPPAGMTLVSTNVGWSPTGEPIGTATIGWNAVTQDVNSNALRIVGYEILTGTAGGVLIARNLNPNPSFEDSVFGGTNNNCTVAQSATWAAQGIYSAAITPNAATNDSYFLLPADQMGMLPLTTYTVIATVHLEAAQTGTLNAMARRLVINAGLTEPVIAPFEPENAAGTTMELRATFTTGATLTATDGIVLWNGASLGGGDVYWDNVAVVPVASEEEGYQYDYFDGDTPDVPGRIFTWAGTPSQSISSAFGTMPGSVIGSITSDLDKPISYTIEGLKPGQTYDVQARAVSAYGVQGILSDILTIVMPPAPAVALEPSAPIVDTRLGVVTAYWDGLLGEAVPLPGFLYVFAEFTREGTEDWAQFGPQLRKAGSVTLTSEPVGSTVHVRLRSVDNLGNISAPSVEAEVVVVGITGPDIEANSVTANHIEAGSIGVTHLEPSVGQTLDISANDAVVIIAGGLDATNSNLEEMQTVYSFTPTEAVISSPESNFTLALDSDSIEIREGGVPVSWWNAGQMHVPSFVGDTVILGNHQLEKFGTGTVMRAL